MEKKKILKLKKRPEIKSGMIFILGGQYTRRKCWRNIYARIRDKRCQTLFDF